MILCLNVSVSYLFIYFAFLVFKAAHAQAVRCKAHTWLRLLLALQLCALHDATEPERLICKVIHTNAHLRKEIKSLKDHVSDRQSAVMTTSME